MRLLFVSGTTTGGSGRSQRELAKQLVRLGHSVLVLADLETPERHTRWLYEQLSDLAAKTERLPGGSLTRRVERLPGRGWEIIELDGVTHRCSPIPENAAPGVIADFRPDVVVGSSIQRLTWRKIGSLCSRHRIPTVLYLREKSALGHFARAQTPGSAFVANSQSLRDEVEDLGHQCAFLPSVIDTSITRTASTRTTALMINPIESHGVETLFELANRLPNIPFVVQESWPLRGEDLARVENESAALTNVEFRRALPPGPALYCDTRVLLVPHRIDNRPRVIAEAQANAIPAIVSEFYGLVEAVGQGGLSLPLDDVEAWCDALTRLWGDEAEYSGLCAAAAENSRREEIDPVQVALRFEQIVTDVVANAARRDAEAGR